MTEGVISKVEALGWAQNQPIMHDGPIVTWRNGDLIAPAFVFDVDAYASTDDIVTPDPTLFLPTLPLGLHDIDVATVAPLRDVPADVGAENVY